MMTHGRENEAREIGPAAIQHSLACPGASRNPVDGQARVAHRYQLLPGGLENRLLQVSSTPAPARCRLALMRRRPDLSLLTVFCHSIDLLERYPCVSYYDSVS